MVSTHHLLLASIFLLLNNVWIHLQLPVQLHSKSVNYSLKTETSFTSPTFTSTPSSIKIIKTLCPIIYRTRNMSISVIRLALSPISSWQTIPSQLTIAFGLSKASRPLLVGSCKVGWIEFFKYSLKVSLLDNMLI